ncbi:MAG: nucleotidyltransferase family protein [Verrucomicrobiae bacterium]|nr:nucleotidyltransferase family protein [Verrucomicrobiae bacterium]
MKVTKAVILAAGKGTRMGELTRDLPKPMVEVNGKPVLQHILEGLKSAGVTDFFIITGYCAEVIENHFAEGSRWGVSITYGRQLVQDGTGKAPEIARDWVGTEAFVMTYGDILVSGENYRKMLGDFERNPHHAQGLITVKPGEDVTKGAIVLFDAAFCLEGIVEKPGPEQLAELEKAGKIGPGRPVWYNAGVYIFTPEIYRHTASLQKSPRGEYELPDAIRALVADGKAVLGFELQGNWVDVRDPQVLKEVQGIKL